MSNAFRTSRLWMVILNNCFMHMDHLYLLSSLLTLSGRGGDLSMAHLTHLKWNVRKGLLGLTVCVLAGESIMTPGSRQIKPHHHIAGSGPSHTVQCTEQNIYTPKPIRANVWVLQSWPVGGSGGGKLDYCHCPTQTQLQQETIKTLFGLILCNH